MAFPKINPTQTQAWAALLSHYQQIKDLHMVDLFEQDQDRVDQMSLEWKDFYLDFSKNRLDKNTLKGLLNLAEECKLSKAIEAQFALEKINETEARAVGHTALRNFKAMPEEVKDTLQKIKDL